MSRLTYIVKLFVVNAVVWGAIHMIMSYAMTRVENEAFLKKPLDLPTLRFEREGQFWEDTLKVKRWKDTLPEGSTYFKSSFDKSTLTDTKPDTILNFYLETNRAEWTHWLSLAPTPLVLLLNPKWTYPIHIAYGLMSNVPFIIIQRYNRPRFKKILRRNR